MPWPLLEIFTTRKDFRAHERDLGRDSSDSFLLLLMLVVCPHFLVQFLAKDIWVGRDDSPSRFWKDGIRSPLFHFLLPPPPQILHQTERLFWFQFLKRANNQSHCHPKTCIHTRFVQQLNVKQRRSVNNFLWKPACCIHCLNWIWSKQVFCL